MSLDLILFLLKLLISVHKKVFRNRSQSKLNKMRDTYNECTPFNLRHLYADLKPLEIINSKKQLFNLPFCLHTISNQFQIGPHRKTLTKYTEIHKKKLLNERMNQSRSETATKNLFEYLFFLVKQIRGNFYVEFYFASIHQTKSARICNTFLMRDQFFGFVLSSFQVGTKFYGYPNTVRPFA